MHGASTAPPHARDHAPQHDLLDRLVLGPERSQSMTALRRYFPGRGTPSRRYTGSGYDSFDGGGQRAEIRNR